MRRNKNLIDSLMEGTNRRIRRVALYIDFPNLYAIMKEKDSFPNLEKVITIARSLGNLVFAKCYTVVHKKQNHVSSYLWLERLGYSVIPRFVPDNDYGIKKDIDTFLAVDAIVSLLECDIDIILIASNDSDFLPVMTAAREFSRIAVALVSSHDEAKLIAESATVYLEGIWNEPTGSYSGNENLNIPPMGGSKQ
ncbi:MAG: NYN domain-containing protein [Thermoplasmatales archaeon]